MLLLKAAAVRWLYRLHRWTGLLTALPIAVLCLTGAVSVFRQDLEWPRSKSQSLSIDAILTAVPQPATAIEFARRDGFAARVYTARSGAFWVDESGASPIAAAGGTPPTEWVARLHRRLLLPPAWGRYVVGFFGFTLVLSSLSGALIYRRFLRGVHRMGKPFWHIRAHWPQLRIADSHKLIGIVSLLFNLTAGATGLVLGIYHPPGRIPKAVAVAKDTRPVTITPTQALETAALSLPGMRPTLVLLPSPNGPRYTIYARFPERSFIRNAASFVVIDARDGKIADRHDAGAEANGLALSNWLEPLHYGYWGGRMVDWLYFVFGLCGTLLALSGPGISLYKGQSRAQRTTSSRT